MSYTVLLLGVITSIFVGFNIGGSSTGIAWGPAVGAGLIRKVTAAAVMTFFVFLGGWTVGRNVMDTLSGSILTTELTLSAGVAVLFFIGFGILVANLFGVPVPTSMTTVGAIGDEYATLPVAESQTASLGLGAVEPRPVVEDGAVVARETLPLSLAVDPRATDPTEAAAFLEGVVGLLESPNRLLLASS